MTNEEFKNESEFVKELDQEIEGKSISQHKIKEIDATSSCLFLTTGNIIFLINSYREWRSYYW